MGGRIDPGLPVHRGLLPKRRLLRSPRHLRRRNAKHPSLLSHDPPRALSALSPSARGRFLLDALLAVRLRQLHQQNRYRDPDSSLRERALAAAKQRNAPFIDASSNDYLGFGNEPLAARRSTSFPWGAGSSRLIHGTRHVHTTLEADLARWLGYQAALLFTSGYAANVGTISSLAAAGDLVVSDALNHASLIDGCRLSRARVQVVPHRDVAAVERALSQRPERTAWVVTESYFSMDADIAPLADLASICRARDAALIVDEAHALGVFGPEGRGVAAQQGVQPDVTIGTFGKAFAAQGAFVAGSKLLRDWLWNTARSFMFSTASSPALAAYLVDQLARVVSADAQRARLHEHAHQLERHLTQFSGRSFTLPASRTGPIFPLLYGSSHEAQDAAERLLQLGVLTQAIRPPTVPEGQSRVRLSLQATFSSAQFGHLSDALARL